MEVQIGYFPVLENKSQKIYWFIHWCEFRLL